MQRVLLFVCVFLIACGSSTPAESPDDSSESDTESSESVPSSPNDKAAESEGASAKASDEPASEAAGDDVKAVLQLVLDDESLDPHLKLTETGRFPLKIAGPGLPEGLIKATKPVVIVAEPSDKKEAVLVFTEIDVKGKEATVRYRYDVEKMKGSAVLKKGPYGWELVRSRQTETSVTPSK
jgi:hypothetical protein